MVIMSTGETEMKKLYTIKTPSVGDKDYRVVHIATGKSVYYGTRAECAGWIERNGHDDSEVL
jgi:hypothetical protein